MESMYEKQTKQNEIIKMIKNVLPYKSIMRNGFWCSWRIDSLFDYEQNYCVYLDSKNEKKEVKKCLENIGAKNFRIANKGYALCFFINEE